MKTQLRRLTFLLFVTLLPMHTTGQMLPVPQKVKALGKNIKAPNGRLLDGKIIFFYNAQPWVTDGTPNGTRLVKDIDPNSSSPVTPNVYTPTVFTNAVYYYYSAGVTTTGLYRTDGTADGTYKVGQLSVDAIGVLPGKLILLAAELGGKNQGLYVSDGTPAGTKKLTASVPVGGVTSFYKIGTLLYFFTNNNTTTSGLWKTDGTEAGTTLVKEIPVPQGQGLVGATSDGNHLFFSVSASTGNAIWRSDGTANGTVPLLNILSPYASFLASINGGHLLYPGDIQGKILNATTTDQAATAQLSDKVPAITLSNGNYGKTDKMLYFTANTSATSSPVYTYMQTDGTVAGTKPVGVIPTPSFPLANPQITTIQGITYFMTMGNYTRIIWRLDEQGQLRQLNAGAKDGSSFLPLPTIGLPEEDGRTALLGEINGKLLFVGTDPETSGSNVPTDFALSSIDLPAAGPVCSLTATISGNITLPCTANATVPLTASATGGASPLTYQWLRNGNVIAGATSTTYAAGSAGAYTVQITDGQSCSTTSTSRTLVTAQPVSVTLGGADVVCTQILSSINYVPTLRANQTGGTAPFSYRWALASSPLSSTTAEQRVNSAGVYSLTVTDACSSSVVSKTLTETVLAVSVSGGSIACTGQPVALTASTTGGKAPYTYAWSFNNGAVVATTPVLAATATNGPYRVVATSADGCSWFADTEKGGSPKPIAATITGSPTLCTSQAGTLTASLTNGTAPYTYQWKLGSTVVGTNASSVSITSGGIYSLSVTDACSSTTVSFTVTDSPSPTVSIGGTLVTCTGQPTTLTATASNGTGAYTYQWKQGSNNVGTNAPSLTATGGNTYALTVTDAKGCAITSATVSVSAVVCASPTVSIPAGGASATSPVTLTASTGLTGGADAGATYQWLLNGTPITGATSSTYIASSSGSYAVVVMVNGKTTTSTAITLTINLILAVEPLPGLSDNQVTTYPNPTTGEFWVKIEVITKQPVTLKVVDELGQSVRQWTISATPKMPPIRVSLPEADGLYLLRVETEKGSVVKKIIRSH